MESEDHRFPLPTAGNPDAYEALEPQLDPSPALWLHFEWHQRDVQCPLQLVPLGGGPSELVQMQQTLCAENRGNLLSTEMVEAAWGREAFFQERTSQPSHT